MALTLVAATSSAQTDSASKKRAPVVVSQTGRVLELHDAVGAPVAGAEVFDMLALLADSVRKEVKLGATSDAGTFRLNALWSRHDTAVVAVRKVGYQESRFVVMIGSSDTVTRVLDRIPTALPAVTSEAPGAENHLSMAMQGFLERSNDKALRGSFIGPGELRTKWEGANMTFALAAHGVDLHVYTPLPVGRKLAGGVSRLCVRFYVDGVSASTLPLPTADSYEAVEVYPDASMAPPMYSGGGSGSCAIVAVWLLGS